MKKFIVKLRDGGQVLIEANMARYAESSIVFSDDNNSVAAFQPEAIVGWWLESIGTEVPK